MSVRYPSHLLAFFSMFSFQTCFLVSVDQLSQIHAEKVPDHERTSQSKRLYFSDVLLVTCTLFDWQGPFVIHKIAVFLKKHDSNCNCKYIFYLQSCLGQETAKGPFGL